MSNKSIVIIIVIGFLFLSLIVAGFMIMWHKLSSLSPIAGESQTTEITESDDVRVTLGPIYPLKTFIVNLADPGGKRYLRVTMELEVSHRSVQDELAQRLPQVRDAILMILPTRTVEETQSLDGKNAIRTEIMGRINTMLRNGTIVNIYFTEFVVQ